MNATQCATPSFSRALAGPRSIRSFRRKLSAVSRRLAGPLLLALAAALPATPAAAADVYKRQDLQRARQRRPQHFAMAELREGLVAGVGAAFAQAGHHGAHGGLQVDWRAVRPRRRRIGPLARRVARPGARQHLHALAGRAPRIEAPPLLQQRQMCIRDR